MLTQKPNLLCVFPDVTLIFVEVGIVCMQVEDKFHYGDNKVYGITVSVLSGSRIGRTNRYTCH